MLKLVYCIRRKSSLSREEFQDYWLNKHAPLVRELSSVLGATKYVQSHTVQSDVSTENNLARGCSLPEFDGVTEFWWADEAAMTPDEENVTQFKSAAEALLKDEREFIDFANSVIFFTVEHIIY